MVIQTGQATAAPAGGSGWRKQSKGFVLAGIAILLTVSILADLFLCTMNSVRPGPVTATGGCGELSPQPGNAGAESGPDSVTAKLRESQVTQVDFGRARAAKRLVVYLDLSGDLPDVSGLHTNVDTFRRDDDGRLSTERVVSNAAVAGRTVQLTLCLGRADGRLGDPGLYRGSITLDDSRLANSVTVPVAVTMQFVHGVALWWLFLFVIVPGTWTLWVLQTQRDASANALALKELTAWVLSVGGIASIVSGVIAAAGVYIGTYVRDPTWGSSALQPVTLFGAMFSAFVTTAGLTQLARGRLIGRDRSART